MARRAPTPTAGAFETTVAAATAGADREASHKDGRNGEKEEKRDGHPKHYLIYI